MTDSLGMRIRLARVRQGMRQTELARRIGISGNAMNQIERGSTDPRASRIKAIAEELGVSADYLLGIGEPVEPVMAASPRQAHPAPAGRHTRRAANGTHPAPAPAPAAAAQPEPSRSTAMCPHCYTPMVSMDDGQGLVCPGCRYQREGDT